MHINFIQSLSAAHQFKPSVRRTSTCSYKTSACFYTLNIKSVATNKNTKQETQKQSCNKKLTPCVLYPAATGTPGSPEGELKGPEVHEKQLISIMKTWSRVSVTANIRHSDIRPDQNQDQVYSQTPPHQQEPDWTRPGSDLDPVVSVWLDVCQLRFIIQRRDLIQRRRQTLKLRADNWSWLLIRLLLQ